MGLYHDILPTAKTSSEKLTQTVVEMHQLPDTENTDSRKELPASDG